MRQERKKKRGYKSITSFTLSTFNKPWLDLAGVNEGNTYGNTEIENQGAGKYSPFFFISFFFFLNIYSLLVGDKTHTVRQVQAEMNNKWLVARVDCSPAQRTRTDDDREPHTVMQHYGKLSGIFFFCLSFFLFYTYDTQSKPCFKGVWR